MDIVKNARQIHKKKQLLEEANDDDDNDRITITIDIKIPKKDLNTIMDLIPKLSSKSTSNWSWS